MSIRVGDLASITERFAAAAIDPSLWGAAVQTVAQATGSLGAVILPVRGSFPGVPSTVPLDALMDTYFRDGWSNRDERHKGVPTMVRRGVFTDLDFATEEEMDRHPYYQELLAPHRLRWFAGVKIAVGDELWALAIQRTIAQGPFSPAAVRRLASMSQRLSSAAALAKSLSFAKAEAAMAAFETSGSAVIFLNSRGQVLMLNSRAEALLGTELQLKRGHLVSWNAETTDALNRQMHNLIWSPDEPALGMPILLLRRGTRPLLAYTCRVPGISHEIFSNCHAAIVLIDLSARSEARAASLQWIFGLTFAEARLAVELASGAELQEVCNLFGITYETARNQLKSIFQKTDTRRQAELVWVLAKTR